MRTLHKSSRIRSAWLFVSNNGRIGALRSVSRKLHQHPHGKGNGLSDNYGLASSEDREQRKHASKGKSGPQELNPHSNRWLYPIPRSTTHNNDIYGLHLVETRTLSQQSGSEGAK